MVVATAAGTVAHATTFTPRTSRTYRFNVVYKWAAVGFTGTASLDQVTYGASLDPANAVLIWLASCASKQVALR